jgi:hypothetical protein
MSRKYRTTPEGEQPVWASNAKLREWGAAEGRAAAREGRKPVRMSNTTYDQAAEAEYKRLTSR